MRRILHLSCYLLFFTAIGGCGSDISPKSSNGTSNNGGANNGAGNNTLDQEQRTFCDTYQGVHTCSAQDPEFETTWEITCEQEMFDGLSDCGLTLDDVAECVDMIDACPAENTSDAIYAVCDDAFDCWVGDGGDNPDAGMTDADAGADGEETFTNEFLAVASIITTNCAFAGCHGGTGQGIHAYPNGTNSSPAEIRDVLDQMATTASGRRLVSPGSPADSEIHVRLTSEDPGKQMPPSGNLPQADIDTIRTWIANGAQYTE